MARQKFKVENMTEKAVGTSGIKKIIVELVPVAVGEPTTDETTVCALGADPGDATGSIFVVIKNPAGGTIPFTIGSEYYINFVSA